MYNFKCDQCETAYVAFTTRHLHQRIQEHKYSTVGKNLINIHGGIDTLSLSSQFSILKKCQTKFDCILYKMFSIRKLNPTLNTQEDSIRAKLLLDCLSRVNTSCFRVNTSCFIFIIHSSFLLVSLLNND